MAFQIGRHRAAKTRRRKQVLAARRQGIEADSAEPLARRVGRAAAQPIRRCLVAGNLFDLGLGPVFLARGGPGGDLGVGVFLVDVYCLGVKDAFFRSVPAWQLEPMIERASIASPLVEAAPSRARKLLRDAVGYAAGLGLAPHRDYAAVEPLFGDVRAEDCDETFTFGHDGKPLYVAGPYEPPRRVAAHLGQLQSRLGDGGFHYIVPVVDEDFEDDEDWAESA